MSTAAALDQAIIAAGVPREAFDGVSIGVVAKGEVLDGPIDPADKARWRVAFTDAATAEHRAAVHAVIEGFDPDNMPAPVPAAVTPLQIRKALRAAGLKAQVDAYVATLDETAQEAWEYATTIPRDDPMIEAAATALEMSPAYVDQLFRTAARL